MAVDISDDVMICDDGNDAVTNCDVDVCDDANPDSVGDKNHQISGDNDNFDSKKATAEILKNEQRTDKSSTRC